MRRCFAGIQPPSRLVLVFVLSHCVVGLVVAVVSFIVNGMLGYPFPMQYNTTVFIVEMTMASENRTWWS